MDALDLFLVGVLLVAGGGTYLMLFYWKKAVDDAFPEKDD